MSAPSTTPRLGFILLAEGDAQLRLLCSNPSGLMGYRVDRGMQVLPMTPLLGWSNGLAFRPLIMFAEFGAFGGGIRVGLQVKGTDFRHMPLGVTDEEWADWEWQLFTSNTSDTALVYADWLEERGMSEWADRLRNGLYQRQQGMPIHHHSLSTGQTMRLDGPSLSFGDPTPLVRHTGYLASVAREL